MAIVRARNPYLWIRWLLLAVGVLGAVALTVFLAAYQFGRAGQEETGETAETPAPRTDAETLTAGQGFDYTQTSEGRRVFRIRAAESQRDRRDTAYLETVILDVFRDDGEVYTITSERARVNEQSWDAELEGDVVMSGWGELEVRARAIKLLQGGQVLVSVGAVELSYLPDLVGRASHLRIDRGADAILLNDGVHVRSTPEAEVPMRLDCERLVYRRGEGLVRALDDVYLAYGDQEISTHALALFLRDDQRTLRLLRARWDVVANLRTVGEVGEESRARVVGQLLEVEPGEDNPDFRRLRVEGGAAEPASIEMVDATGLARRISGDFLESHSAGGVPQIIEGFGAPMVIDEYLDFDPPFPLRRACADHGTARFLPDGTLAQIHLEEQVELRDHELHLSGGSWAVLDAQEGVLDIEGPEVVLYDERGELSAPHVRYRRDKGIVRAGPGVRATLLQAAALAESPLGRGRGPIRVESVEAVWTNEPSTFSFRGGVRAWRGQNLLLADQLRGDETAGELAASGDVKTVWFPEADDGSRGQPIEVVAEQLTFREAENLLLYSGGVRVEQAERTLTCRELSVVLEERTSQAERMICKGEVHLIDPIANRQVWGETAIYEVPASRIEISGDEVRLRDAEQNTMVGKYLVYDLEAGNVQLRGQRPAAGGGG